MVLIRDSVDAVGTLASFSNNRYINVYKPKLPIIQVLRTDGESLSLSKNELTQFDVWASNFTHFGYKVYTSTGTYSGANLITNGNFDTNIAGWSTTWGSASHDNTWATLIFTQDPTLTGMVSSNTFSLSSGALYEVSGTFRSLTGSYGKHVTLALRQDGTPFTLYGDRIVDLVATASGTDITAYVRAVENVNDARLDITTHNASHDISLDNIRVREVTGLTNNPRTNEVRLMINSGSSSASFACPGGGGCSLQYRDTTDTAVSFPTNIGAYSSKIILWRDPNSSFTPTNILHKPTGSLVPSAGSVPNNTTVDLTWSSDAMSTLLSGATNTWSFTYSLAQSGTISILPPNDGTNTYTLNIENDIGTTIYTADVVTSNTPPVTIASFGTWVEDSLSITGMALASDINSGWSLSYSLFDPPALSQGTMNSFDGDGLFDFRPTSNFCGNATFTYRAFDAFGMGSDAITPGVVTVYVACTNDAPVAIDDSFTSTGWVSNLLDVLSNETDIDSPYETQTFFLTGFTNPTHGTLSITGNVFEYVPNAMYVWPDLFLYTMVDQSGWLSNTGTVTLNVIPGSNLPPLVSGSGYNLVEDTNITATLSGYDLNPWDVLTFTIATLPTNGMVTLSGADFTYTPNTNYNTSDSFTFTANDGTLTSSSATISLTINGTQDVPVVTDDTIGVEMSAVVTLDVMANDTDADTPYSAENLSISGYSLPANGTLSVVGTGFQYISNTPFIGTDSFTYTIADASGNLSNTGTVTLNVTSTNTPPLSYSGVWSTNEDTSVVGTLSGYDADGTPLTFQLVSSVGTGNLSLGSTGSFVYTPPLNYFGTASFTFRVTDGVFPSNISTVDISVTPVNDAPIAWHDTATWTEDTTLVLTWLLLNDYDVDIFDTLTLSSILTQWTNGTAILSGTTDIIYTPNLNFCGMDSVTYNIVDQSGATSGTGNIAITLVCTNDAPIASGSSYTITGNIATNSGYTLTGGFAVTDVDLDVLTYTLDSTVTNGLLIFSTGGSFQYTPNLGYSGSDSFSFSATDGIATTATASISITVQPNNFNIAPIAYSGTFTVNEDTILVSTLSWFDVEGSALTFILWSGTTNGILSLGSTGSFVYTPSSHFFGTDVFTFAVSDWILSSVYVTGTIAVNSVNDLPVANNDSATWTEDTTILIPVLGNDTDIDGTVVALSGLTQSVTGGIATIVGTGILFTPTANFCNVTPITLSYYAVDNNGWVSLTPATLSLSIGCIDDLPIANNDSATWAEDTAILIPVLENDFNLDASGTLTLVSVTQSPTGGTATIAGTGILFTPTANFCSISPVTFTYNVRNSLSVLVSTATVSLSITCTNDTPVVSNSQYEITWNTQTWTVNSFARTLTWSDIEWSPLTFSIASPVSTGSLSLGSTGAFTYTPPTGFVGSTGFMYTADDGSLSSTPATVTFCVISPNSTIARPSCASSIADPNSLDGKTGGGGGGGSASTFTNTTTVVGGVDMSYYTKVETSSPGVSTSLLTQLLLGKTSPKEKISLDSSVSSLLSNIKTFVEISRDVTSESRKNARDIRLTGKQILTSIMDNSTLSNSAQLTELQRVKSEITATLIPKPREREYKALRYVLRIFSARENLLRDTIDFLSDLTWK
jgi:large repetitive protein